MKGGKKKKEESRKQGGKKVRKAQAPHHFNTQFLREVTAAGVAGCGFAKVWFISSVK